jgi:hypothetical protein
MSDIDKIKKELNAKTSEDLFGISKQPKEQCPLIDKVLCELEAESRNIKYAYWNLKDIEEAEPYLSDLDWAEYNLRNMDGNLEELRTNITNLRTWGEEWKDFAKYLLNERKDFIDLLDQKYAILLHTEAKACV